MSRIGDAFSDGKAFIAFITCGDPDLETTAKTVRAMTGSGADMIELGIPFSDPVAEGKVIQSANARALSGGVTVDRIFGMVRELRRDVRIPLVFMTYANVVFSYGPDRFASECRVAGIDGLILPDVPYEEKEEFAPICRRYGVDLISMVAPTSEDRISAIASDAEGFVYIVSSMGVTGVRNKITSDVGRMAALVRKNTDIPCAVGFGISTPEQAAEMAELSDGAIVGSAIVRIIAEHGKDSPEYAGEYVREMKKAVSGGLPR
ncbi:MAG: tryptophan synthase subunit alpha [Candidatus Methanoplasma sp.]|jgi:tryptophan synthase alpha chain|nr:tryptophan synthase subunit alpha [Candidatus Methanoplasma sp.]